MARMPGAEWRPLAADWNKQSRMTAHDIVCIHTMVGSLEGTQSYFESGNGAGYAGTESHYGTGGGGHIRQWQDTAYQADANFNGNGNVISVENADRGVPFPNWNVNDSSQVPAFTPEQIEANAKILAWECSRAAHAACPPSWRCYQEGIPLALIPDTKPGRRGVAYHRQGIEPWLVAGGVKWSSTTGKPCPGNRRIAQIPQVITRAQQILNGDDDMPWSQWPVEEKNAFGEWLIEWVLPRVADTYAQAVTQREFPKRGPGATGKTSLEQEVAWLPTNLASIAAAASGGTDVAALRSVLVQAVQEGMAAGQGATAEQIVDALAARLAS